MSTKQPTIFGREPAAVVGAVEAALALLLSWNLFHLSAETVSLIVAAVAAGLSVYTAYVTRDTLLGVTVGFIKALLALYVGFGFDLTTNQTAAIIALTVAVASLYHRTQTAPAAQASFRDPDLPVAASSAAVAASEDGSGFVTGQWLDKAVVDPQQPLDGA